jgi:hypothetical protein
MNALAWDGVKLGRVQDGQHAGYYAATKGDTTVYGRTPDTARELLEMVLK